MILVDTSVWIDFLRGTDTPFRRRLHDLIESGEDLCLTGIIVAEILQGTRGGQVSDQVSRFLLDFPVFEPRSVHTYVEAANIYRRCRRSGKTIRKTIDCIIAAVAIENDLILFHNDADFVQIAECTSLKALTKKDTS